MAQSIVETARRETRSLQLGALREIGMRIGAMSGVLVESLEFCFEAITKDTDLDGCRLAVERLPVVANCRDCKASFEVERFAFACPECKSGAVDITQGYELEIAYLEVDEMVPNPEDSSNQGVHNAYENPA